MVCPLCNLRSDQISAPDRMCPQCGFAELPPQRGFWAHAWRGLFNLRHMGKLPGLGVLFWLVLSASLFNARSGITGMLFTAGVMFLVMGSMVLVDAAERSVENDLIDCKLQIQYLRERRDAHPFFRDEM